MARTTARKALALIRDEGWSFASVGLGYYVAPREQWPEVLNRPGSREPWPGTAISV